MKVIKIPRKKVEQVEKVEIKTKPTNKKDKEAFAQWMRDNPTRSEKKFLETWKSISSQKIVCQFVLSGFIADFYVRTKRKKLIIEIDGSVHDKQVEYDRRRDEIFREKGFDVLRITARHVMRDPVGAVQIALQRFEGRSTVPKIKRVQMPTKRKPKRRKPRPERSRKSERQDNLLREFMFATEGL